MADIEDWFDTDLLDSVKETATWLSDYEHGDGDSLYWNVLPGKDIDPRSTLTSVTSLYGGAAVDTLLGDSVADDGRRCWYTAWNRHLPGEVESWAGLYIGSARSIKGRAALNMILAAEEKGLLKPGDTIVENTSGNTGIGLAAFSASRGYKLEVFMEPGQSIERLQILKAYGATVHIMTDLPEVAKALADRTFTVQFYQDALQRYCDAQPTHYYFINQLANEANPGAHYDHTGPEIWEATGGKVDYVVALAGTAGTITGLGRYFREKNPDVKIIAAQPSISSRPSPENPHPATIDGVNPFNDPGFPDAAKAPFIVDFKYDECFDINGEDAYATGRGVSLPVPAHCHLFQCFPYDRRLYCIGVMPMNSLKILPK